MKRFFLFLVGASLMWLAPSWVRAQEVKTPKCLPMVNGYPVGFPIIHQTTRFCHAYQMCTNKDGKGAAIEGVSWPRRTLECTPQDILVKLWPMMMEIHAASAKVTTAHKLYRDNVKFDCTDPAILAEQTSERGRMCRERNDLLKANHKVWWK